MPIVPAVPGTRFDRVGSVFSRVTGLIRSGTLSGLDIPIWYPIYKTFRPKFEPSIERKVPLIKICDLAYREDDERVVLHASKQIRPIDLTLPIEDESRYFRSQAFPRTEKDRDIKDKTE